MSIQPTVKKCKNCKKYYCIECVYNNFIKGERVLFQFNYKDFCCEKCEQEFTKQRAKK